MSIISDARKYRKLFLNMRDEATDATASACTDLFPRLKQDNSLVKSGTRINWNGTIKRAAVDLWDTVENNPDNAPTLWEDIDYKEGYRIIPEIITVGITFSKGEKGWWEGVLYESILDNNAWTPASYPAGWTVVD